MRRLVVAIVILAVALSLAGCGGGAATSSSSSDANAAAPAAASAAPVDLPVIDNRSANASDTFVPFPSGTNVPGVLKQKIGVQKQATLIFFSDPSQASREVRNIIDDVRYRNRGLVDLVVFDLGKYMSANPDGTVEVDPGLANDAASKLVVSFARDPAIGVSYTPFMVLTDSQGYIIFKHAGLIDSAFLEREVQRAAE